MEIISDSCQHASAAAQLHGPARRFSLGPAGAIDSLKKYEEIIAS